MATTGKMIDTSAGLPAASVTVTVAVAVAGLAVSGVPVMTPVPTSMLSPGGRSEEANESMSVAVVLGIMSAMVTPTSRASGAVYVGAVGAIRSTVTMRVRSPGGVKPAFSADTVTVTDGPTM